MGVNWIRLQMSEMEVGRLDLCNYYIFIVINLCFLLLFIEKNSVLYFFYSCRVIQYFCAVFLVILSEKSNTKNLISFKLIFKEHLD